MKKLAVITTHPIQYNSPLFSLLHARKLLTIKIFYTWGEGVMKDKYDPGFRKVIAWDIPLLTGYDYTFVNNVSKEPGSHHFSGIDNTSLLKDIEDWGPDALLVFGWNFKSHLKVLRHFSKQKKILFRGDSTLLDEDPAISIKKYVRRLLLRWVYKHIDTALYVGTANKMYYKSMGLKDKQLVFAPHAIDNVRFQITTKNFRAMFEIPDNAIVFLYAGKLEHKKNPVLLLQSFIELDHINSHLMLVGNGILESSLKATVEHLHETLKQRIHFMEFQNQSAMPSIYHTADVYVLPSQGPNETWGLAVNEAMAAGNAVLVSDRCGCSCDLVEEGINGFEFRSNDKRELIKKMQSICNDGVMLKRMKLASRHKITHWNLTATAEAIENSILKPCKFH